MVGSRTTRVSVGPLFASCFHPDVWSAFFTLPTKSYNVRSVGVLRSREQSLFSCGFRAKTSLKTPSEPRFMNISGTSQARKLSLRHSQLKLALIGRCLASVSSVQNARMGSDMVLTKLATAWIQRAAEVQVRTNTATYRNSAFLRTW